MSKKNRVDIVEPLRVFLFLLGLNHGSLAFVHPFILDLDLTIISLAWFVEFYVEVLPFPCLSPWNVSIKDENDDS
jgi:hypothetical protein